MDTLVLLWLFFRLNLSEWTDEGRIILSEPSEASKFKVTFAGFTHCLWRGQLLTTFVAGEQFIGRDFSELLTYQFPYFLSCFRHEFNLGWSISIK